MSLRCHRVDRPNFHVSDAMLESAQVFDAIGQAMQRFRVSPEQLQELQQRKLRELLRHAMDHSPFYQKLYGSIDVDLYVRQGLPATTMDSDCEWSGSGNLGLLRVRRPRSCRTH